LNLIQFREPFIYDAQMDHESLDDWIISLLSNHTIRQIAKLLHVSVNRVRAVRDAHLSGAKLFHRLGAPCKATPEIKQSVIDLTILHPNFSDFQIAQMIADQYAITISRSTINRLRHLECLSVMAAEFSRSEPDRITLGSDMEGPVGCRPGRVG
jgi:hypothetical protein